MHPHERLFLLWVLFVPEKGVDYFSLNRSFMPPMLPSRLVAS